MVDVGAAAISGHEDDVIGSPLYMAPEVFAGELQTDSADVYSFGKMLGEMLGLTHDDKMLESVITDQFSEDWQHVLRVRDSNDPFFNNPENTAKIPDKYTRDKMIALLKRMTDIDPDKRPSMQTVLTEIDTLRIGFVDSVDKVKKIGIFNAEEYYKYPEKSPERQAIIKLLKAADEVWVLDTVLNRSEYDFIAMQKEFYKNGIILRNDRLLQAVASDVSHLDVLEDTLSQISQQEPNILRNYSYVTMDLDAKDRQIQINNAGMRIEVPNIPRSEVVLPVKPKLEVERVPEPKPKPDKSNLLLIKMITQLSKEHARLDHSTHGNNAQERADAIRVSLLTLTSEYQNNTLDNELMKKELHHLQSRVKKLSSGLSKTETENLIAKQILLLTPTKYGLFSHLIDSAKGKLPVNDVFFNKKKKITNKTIP